MGEIFKMLYSHATPEMVRFLRIAVYGMWFIHVLVDPLPVIANLPASVFDPAGFLIRIFPVAWQEMFVTEAFLHVLKITMLFTLILVILNRWMKVSAVISCILLTVYQGIIRGFGSINHAEIILLFAAYLIMSFILIDSRTPDERRREVSESKFNPSSAPFFAILVFSLLGYSFVGINRLVDGGYQVFTSDSLIVWMVQNSNRGDHFFLWNFTPLILQYPSLQVLVKIGFAVVNFFEIFAPFCLISKRFRYAFIVVIYSFLIINWIFMRILFLENMILFILLFDITPWFKRKNRFSQVTLSGS